MSLKATRGRLLQHVDRFPRLISFLLYVAAEDTMSDGGRYCGIKDKKYLTEVATLNAKGAWKLVEQETRRTDCAAKDVGPKLSRSTPKRWKLERFNRTVTHKLAATKNQRRGEKIEISHD